MDAELADEYYTKHYARTNNTMVICTPHIPMKPDLRTKKAQTFSARNLMVGCNIYQLGFLKSLYERRHWSYIFSANLPLETRIYVIATTAVVIIAGSFKSQLIDYFRGGHNILGIGGGEPLAVL